MSLFVSRMMEQFSLKRFFIFFPEERWMEPDPGELRERFMEGLAFSLLIVLLTNVFSLFLTIGSMEDSDSSPTPFLKEESPALKSLHASNADGEKQASGGGLLPPLSMSRENSTSQEYFPLDK
ncbi:MAG: hypothetical protein ACP5PQ_05505 [Thermoproteota archaeon]